MSLRYNAKKYGYYEKNVSEPEEISDVVSNKEFIKFLFKSSLEFIEKQTYSKNENETIPRFYNLEVLKDNLKKINVSLYSFEKETNKNDLALSSKRHNMMSFLYKKQWSDEKINSECVSINDELDKLSNKSTFSVIFDTNNLINTPISDIDFYENLSKNDPSFIEGLYNLALNCEKETVLVGRASDTFEKRESLIRAEIREVIKDELKIDTFKYIIKNKMKEMKDIFKTNNDIIVYENLLEYLSFRMGNKAFYMLLEDSKSENFMDINLYVCILNRMKNWNPVYKTYAKVSINSCDDTQESFLEHINILLKNLKNEDLNNLEEQSLKKINNMLKILMENINQINLDLANYYAPYEKEISAWIKRVEGNACYFEELEYINQHYYIKTLKYLPEIIKIKENIDNLINNEDNYGESKLNNLQKYSKFLAKKIKSPIVLNETDLSLDIDYHKYEAKDVERNYEENAVFIETNQKSLENISIYSVVKILGEIKKKDSDLFKDYFVRDKEKLCICFKEEQNKEIMTDILLSVIFDIKDLVQDEVMDYYKDLVSENTDHTRVITILKKLNENEPIKRESLKKLFRKINKFMEEIDVIYGFKNSVENDYRNIIKEEQILNFAKEIRERYLQEILKITNKENDTKTRKIKI